MSNGPNAWGEPLLAKHSLICAALGSGCSIDTEDSSRVAFDW
jgi:hypothetical protein